MGSCCDGVECECYTNIITRSIPMYHSISRRTVTVETQILSQVSPCGISGQQAPLGQAYIRVFLLPPSIKFQQCSIIFHRQPTETV